MAEIVSLSDRRQATGRKSGSDRKGTRRSFGYVRKLPSKRYQASYTGPDGRRHNAPTTFTSKVDANAWLALQSAAITEQRWKPAIPAPPPKPELTIADYAERWLGARDLKPRTRTEYRRLLDAKILPSLGSIPLVDLTAADIRAWHADTALWARTVKVRAKGKVKSETVPTPTARAHAYALLRTILAAAVDEELLEVNPARIKAAGTAKRTRAIRPATLDELGVIADAMPAKYRLMVHLASWCGLRYGELAELRRGDVDLRKSPVLRIRRAVTWPAGQPVVGTPKSDAGVRDVHVPPHLVPLIRDHLDAHAGRGKDGLLFPNALGQHLHHGSLYKVYKPARAKAGRPDLRWHDLRHTGATLSAQAGATVRELMDRIGHSTPAMAMRYQHVADGRAAEIARRLSDIAESRP
ncbi:MAG: site-specific integrase [Microlunatus sp.]